VQEHSFPEKREEKPKEIASNKERCASRLLGAPVVTTPGMKVTSRGVFL
jgi:hypothetical protein